MAAGRGIGLILLVVVAGLVVGSLLGELLGSLFPAGSIHDLIVRGPSIGLTPPATLDLRLLADRKSTRLNSSHGYISYAVFCLKKKKKKHNVRIVGYRTDNVQQTGD